MNDFFTLIARKTADAAGSPAAVSAALVFVLVWAGMGPVFGFSAQWQLFMNTVTTVLTFLMVFLIQGAQNHDSRALHAKLDEVITHLEGPRDEVAGIETQGDREIEKVKEAH